MTAQNRTTLKGYFNTGDTPTESNFADLIDSFPTGAADGADVTSATNVASSIHGASAKTTPVDADTFPIIDSAASNGLKKITLPNLRTAVLLATPPRIRRTVKLLNGVTTGVVDGTTRTANATAMQATLDAAASAGDVVDAGDARVEYDATRVVSSVNYGLQVPPGVPVFCGYGLDTRLVQYAAAHPCLTLGDTNISFENEYMDFATHRGTTGTAGSRSLLIGDHFKSRFKNIDNSKNDAAGLIRHPEIGIAGIPGVTIFSCVFETITAGGGQANFIYLSVDGTGNVFTNVYCGGGSSSEITTISDRPVRLANMTQGGVWQQLNIEWCRWNNAMLIENCTNTIIDEIHIEGCHVSGANPVGIRSFSNTQTELRGVQFYGNEIVSADHTGTQFTLFSCGGSASMNVQGLEVRNAGGSWGQIETNAYLFRADSATENSQFSLSNGRMPLTNVGNSSEIIMEWDPSLPAATYGRVVTIDKYDYRPERSKTLNAKINTPANADFTTYGAQGDLMIRCTVPITADRKIILSDKMAHTTPGSNVPRVPGDRVRVRRESNATGAFNILVRDQTDANTLATLSSVSTEEIFYWTGTTWVTG